MACLIITKRRLGKGSIVYSDGSEEKWALARWLALVNFGDLCRSLFKSVF